MFRLSLAVSMLAMVFLVSLISLLPKASVWAKEIDQNTMSLWTFDESKGNTTADLSENGHNLKIEGKSKWIKGKFGNALWFDKDAFVAHNPGKAIEDFSF